MTADYRLLRISLAPIRQAFSIGARAYPLYHALDDTLGDDGGDVTEGYGLMTSAVTKRSHE